jgi:hypothetical protein
VKILALSVCLLGAVAGADEPERRSPLYTNADLERAGAGRPAAEPGRLARPAESTPRPDRGDAPLRGREEAYWRAEADRFRTRLLSSRTQLEELQATLAQKLAPRAPELRPVHRQRRDDSAAIDATTRRIESLRRRIADEEMRFLDRARQAGALPGWIRSATE